MMIKKRDIIVLGECLVEYSLKNNQDLNLQGIGGDCLTTAVAASRLGSKVDLISVIGLDAYGEFIRSKCEEENINLFYTDKVNGYNGFYVSRKDDPEMRETFFYRPGDAARHINSSIVHEEHIKEAKIVHSSAIAQAISPSARKAVFKAFELCHINGGMTSYDPNLRLRLWDIEDAKEAMWSLMPFIDVIFPSAPEESKALFGYERPLDVVGFLWDHGVNVVVVKNGPNNCLIGYDKKIEEIEVAPVEGGKNYSFVGSAFSGSFLHGISSGLDPFKSARIAVKAAAIKLKRAGSIIGLAKSEDIEELL